MSPAGHVSLSPPRHLILIGASTGGTRVITQLLGWLPPLPAAVVVVQHMPKFINESLVRTLSQTAPMEVRLAQDGDWLREGLVLVAPSEAHCTLQRNQRVRLAPGPKVNFVCPSVDVMMQSVKAPPAGQRLIGVLLTGMGKDGAAGLAHLKRLGALTIAQDEASSAVYGMPAEAVKLGCVDHELAPEGILRLLTLKAAR